MCHCSTFRPGLLQFPFSNSTSSFYPLSTSSYMSYLFHLRHCFFPHNCHLVMLDSHSHWSLCSECSNLLNLPCITHLWRYYHPSAYKKQTLYLFSVLYWVVEHIQLIDVSHADQALVRLWQQLQSELSINVRYAGDQRFQWFRHSSSTVVNGCVWRFDGSAAYRYDEAARASGWSPRTHRCIGRTFADVAGPIASWRPDAINAWCKIHGQSKSRPKHVWAF